MAVYKEEKTGTWRVIYRYTDWTGEKKQTQKRGFKTKREAQAWEREQLNKAAADLDMTFKSFVEQYTADMKTRIKENTWATKEHIIRTKLIPYFGKLKMCSITAQQIITWQNELMNHKDEKGKPYSPVYLKTVHNQLSAIFNHAVRYYNLRDNPCKKAGSMGKKKNREMLFWTKEDYLKMLYGIQPTDRMFTVTKSYLHREMDRGAKEAGVQRIRIHDIRHSAVSLLIDMGFSATAIADRVGHESIDITYNYAHLFPSRQTEMADKLNMERGV